MSTTCPKCGAAIERSSPYKTPTAVGLRIDFDCQSQILFSTDGDIQKIKWRGYPCYETQLAQQADLLRRAREVVRTYRGLKKDYNSGGCVCSDCQKLDEEAAALLPDLEAAERIVAWREED